MVLMCILIWVSTIQRQRKNKNTFVPYKQHIRMLSKPNRTELFCKTRHLSSSPISIIIIITINIRHYTKIRLYNSEAYTSLCLTVFYFRIGLDTESITQKPFKLYITSNLSREKVRKRPEKMWSKKNRYTVSNKLLNGMRFLTSKLYTVTNWLESPLKYCFSCRLLVVAYFSIG